jgi:hypothetical protein
VNDKVQSLFDNMDFWKVEMLLLRELLLIKSLKKGSNSIEILEQKLIRYCHVV